jgi:lantibiotic biosynthesis protein
MEKIPFKILDEVIVRSPIYTYKSNVSTKDIYAIIENDFFLESIYVASPTLYDETIKLKNGELKTEKETEKLVKTLFRYYYRMCTRSTPFGLFSTCGVLGWGNEEVTEKFYRHTRLDMLFLQKFVSDLSLIPKVNEHILYHTNNSIYVVDSEIRYMEYTYQKGFRQYTISAVTKNAYIEKVLRISKKGVSKSEIMENLHDIAEDDAQNLIQNMIDSQLLISEFEVAPTSNDDFGKQIITHLTTIQERTGSEYIEKLLTFFQSIINDIKVLDSNETNKIEDYKNIIFKLKQLQPDLDETKIFHIDSYKSYQKAKIIRENAKDELLEVLQFLIKMNGGLLAENSKITAFKNKFLGRYDTQTMPLVDVLDEDFGIGYPVDRRLGLSPLVDDIPVQSGEIVSQMQFNKVEKWMGEVLKDAYSKNLYSIDLSTQILPSTILNKDNFKGLPFSLSAMFRLINDTDETMVFEGFVGPSASGILARFAYGNDEIRNAIDTIVSEEEQNLDNGILAEIVHVPDNRVTNVIAHPTFRKYGIPYLAKPAKDEQVIDIQDLFIKIEQNEIILFSKKLNQRIIPCKTQMHNHVYKTLPFYHLLTDLQSEISKRNVNFSWGSISGFYSFYPRVYFKKTIISPATWNLPQTLIGELKKQKDEVLLATVKTMKEDYKMPNLLLYVEGDNELLLDFTNETSIQIWLNLIKNKPFVFLKEFLWNSDSTMQSTLNQYVATIINTEKKYFPSPIQQENDIDLISVKRELCLDSDWIYLKLYCGAGSADTILLRTILPILQEMAKYEMIKKWFFIKYHDTDYHIRLRFQLHEGFLLDDALKIIYQHLHANKSIWKIQPENYVREIERYGINSIEFSESIFCMDSEMSIELFYVLQKTRTENQVFWWGMRLVDDFLNAFGLNIEDKILFVDLIRKGFQEEFGSDKKAKEVINSKYNLSIIKEVMGNDNKEIAVILKNKIIRQKPYIDEILSLKNEHLLVVNFNALLSSFIHMMLNRLITNKERLHEFLIYEFLYKYYQMKIRVN